MSANDPKRTFGLSVVQSHVGCQFCPKQHNAGMADQKLGFWQLIQLFSAMHHVRKGALEKARLDLDEALSSTGHPVPFILAYDALLMIKEDRLQKARTRFSECVRNIGEHANVDDRYVALFCRVYLNMYDEKLGYDEIEKAALEANAARSSASWKVRACLLRFKIESLKKNFGHRKSTSARLGMLDDSIRPHHVEAALDF